MANKYVNPSGLKHHGEKILETVDKKIEGLVSEESLAETLDEYAKVDELPDDYDDTALSNRVTANEEAITKLNGSGDGSVVKTVDNALNEFATNISNDGVVNTYKELVDYAASHSSDVAEMVADIEANVTAIEELDSRIETAENDLNGAIKLQGRHTTQADSASTDGFSLTVSSSDGIDSHITLIDSTNGSNTTSVYPAELRTPSLYTDKISPKTYGKRISVQGNLDVNDFGAASATIPWFDGNTNFDGAMNVNSTVTAVDGFIGDLNGTATKATKLSNTSAIGSSTKPVYINASGTPTACSYTLGKSVPSDAVFTDTTYSNFVKSGSGAKAGLVPAPSTTAGTTKFLREDGTWSTPSTGSDTKVNVKLETTTKAYLLGTSTTPTSTTTGVTAIADTGVYLDTVAGRLTAKEFVGTLYGNADSASYAIEANRLSSYNIGSSLEPIYFDANGRPTKCGFILGDACERGVTTTLTSSHSNLITSGAVYNTINDFYDTSKKILNVKSYGSNTYTGTVDAMFIAGAYNELYDDCSDGIICGTNNIVGNSYYLGLFGSDNNASNTNSVLGNTLVVGSGNYFASYLEDDIIIGASNKIHDDLYESLVVGTNNGVYSMTYNSIIAGYGNYISGYNSVKAAFAFGRDLDVTPHSFAIGHYNSYLDGSESGSGGAAFVIGNGSSTNYANAMYIKYDGAVYSDGAYNAYGADYAEFIEWEDGNTNEEDRVAKFVTLHGDKLVIANSGDYIAGVVSAVPSIIGNLGGTGWQGKYLKDNFGRWLTKEVVIVDEETEEEHITTERIVNPDYDPTQEFIPRDERIEWAPVGMLGFLRVYDDGTCEVDGYCKCADGGIATSATVEENSFLTPIYRVVNRITDDIVEIYFR